MTKKQQKELNKIIKTIVKKYEPEKIILFGSYLSKRQKASSDVDLAVIKRTQRRFPERLRVVSSLIKSPLGTDILIYTPEEWKKSLQAGDYFIKEILETGRLVYEK